ncbi:MAG: hypothetical protein AAFR21_12090 [Pseudomonadota bacterium]
MVTAEKPYAGLTFYEHGQSEIFAGRSKEADKCGDLLFQSDVLVLHGRTGCGKSSFLRAGLRPRLERSGLNMAFSDDAQASLRVVRSSASPLRSVAGEVWDMANSVLNEDPLYTGGDKAVALEVLANLDREAFIERFGTSASRTEKAINSLTDSFEVTPIIVIDQAEEYLTLRDAFLETNDDPRAERTLAREQRAFFSFINSAARGRVPSAKLIVSLRSEYKGEFDDMVNAAGPRPGRAYSSFHLAEMNREQLVEAIVRPTLSDAQLAMVLGRETTEGLPNMKEQFGFRYADDVPELIADWLTKRGTIAQGGLLPAMQVACLRLYETSRARDGFRSKRRNIIRASDVLRLGEAGNQVSEFLREKLQAALRNAVDKHRERSGETTSVANRVTGEYSSALSFWYKSLGETLMRLEADGRATTNSVEIGGEKGLEETLHKNLHNRQIGGVDVTNIIDAVLDELARENVLRRDLRGGKQFWTLGHDSLALALNAWTMRFGRRLDAPMKMGMNSARAFKDYDYDDLFGDEKIMAYTVDVPTDFLWDHQLAHFASAMKFDERIGIRFRKPDALSTTANAGGGRKFEDWNALCEEILDYEEELRHEAHRHVLVPGEIESFPRMDRGVGEWTDVLVTDLFQGNTLIGNIEFEDNVFQHENLNVSNRVDSQLEAIKTVLRQLAEMEKAEIYCLLGDKSAESFLKLACYFADVDFAKIKDRCRFIAPSYEGKDILFENLLRKANSDTEEQGRFMVSTAFGRALAEQANFQMYFSAVHLMDLVDNEIIAKKRRQPHLVEAAQKIFLHTLWQIGVSPAQWRDSESRGFILRLASIGYYTAEFILSSTDVFVSYLHEWVNRSVLSDESENKSGVGSNQIGLEVVENAVQACFSFLNFDEYPRVIYNLEATRAYWWEIGGSESEKAKARDKIAITTDARRRGARSVAGEIYMELTHLRSGTLQAFETASRHLHSLRLSGDLEKVDPELDAGLKLIERAWRNFKIFNFFDSQRQMASAAEHLRSCLERFQLERIATTYES